MRKWLLLMMTLMVSAAQGSPCTGIDRNLSNSQKQTWAPVIAKQLRVANVDVLQVFRDGDWRVIYLDTHVSDNGFLFYHGDPLRGTFITSWAGAAMENDEASVGQWVQQHVPGISERLARCFAWHVTKDRDA